MVSNNVKLFGRMPNGDEVYQIELDNGFLSCGIISYGGALRYLCLKDKRGKTRDVLLGYDSVEDYIRQDKYIGALIGRYANRIGRSAFHLGGRRYPLRNNDGRNHLHGGPNGFDKRLWNIAQVDADCAVLTLESADGEEGYPGQLSVCVEYRLAESTLSIDYSAETTEKTICNLTNHAYFNLDGHNNGSIGRQQIRILADYYTPTDDEAIPKGEIAEVEGTPMNLRELTAIGAHIDDDFEQLHFSGGYDHNWVIRGEYPALRKAAEVIGAESGIKMETYTTMPGLQFYSGNYLDGLVPGKQGANYHKRSGFCLETQFYPDSPNHRHFPQAILNAGEQYHHRTEYRFSLI